LLEPRKKPREWVQNCVATRAKSGDSPGRSSPHDFTRDALVDLFIPVLNDRIGTLFSLRERPDELVRDRPQIEAVAVDTSSGAVFRIEHTRLEPFEGEGAVGDGARSKVMHRFDRPDATGDATSRASSPAFWTGCAATSPFFRREPAITR
jgi:hypothetical protein